MKKKLIALLLCIQAALLGGCGGKSQAEPDVGNGQSDTAVESTDKTEDNAEDTSDENTDEDAEDASDENTDGDAEDTEEGELDENVDEILDMAALKDHAATVSIDLAAQADQTYQMKDAKLETDEYIICDLGELKTDDLLSASFSVDSKAAEDDRITVGILKGYRLDELKDEEYLLDDVFQQVIEADMSFTYQIPEDDAYLLCITSNSESTLKIKNGKLFLK